MIGIKLRFMLKKKRRDKPSGNQTMETRGGSNQLFGHRTLAADPGRLTADRDDWALSRLSA